MNNQLPLNHIFIVTVIILLPLFSCSENSIEKNGGLVLNQPYIYWAFDESSGNIIKDETGHFHGRINKPKWISKCISGSCLSFDGTSEGVIIGQNFSFNLWNKKEPNFTIVALPDTQYYSLKYHSAFPAQTRWIAENKKKLNIKFVVHLGDIVNHPFSKPEWGVAKRSMDHLEGVVPYLLVPGNHDIENLNKGTRNYLNYNEYFPISRFLKYPWYGGHFPPNGNQNNYGFLDHEGKQYLVLGLTFFPNANELNWANKILKQYKNKLAIIFTHEYMDYRGNTRTQNGNRIFNNFIKNHPNIVLVLSGHMLGPGVGLRTDYIDGQPVHQILHNCQMFLNGGQGFLRYYTFNTSENVIDVKTYSPSLKKFNRTPENEFSLSYRKQQFSVSAWIKTDQLSDQMVVAKQGSTDGSFYLSTQKIDESRGAITFGITNSSAKIAVGSVNFPYADNRWHYLVGTYDGKRIKIFVDGKLLYSLPSDKNNEAYFLLPEGPIKKTSFPIRIGSYDGPDWKFRGGIDEVKLFKNALTPEDISKEYLKHAE